jgi:hypothetical protein
MQQTPVTLLPTLCALTLVCCTLLAFPLLRFQLLFAVAAQRLEGDLFARLCAHRWKECGVVHRLVRTVGAKDRCAYMLLHLSAVECAWSHSSLLALQ